MSHTDTQYRFEEISPLVFYRFRAVTTLTVVDSGSLRLQITKSGWLRQKSQAYKVSQQNACRFDTV